MTTASGGCDASHVVVCACCSRTAREGISRLPNRAASASTVAASACGSGRFKLLVMVRPTRYPPGGRPWQRLYKGSRDHGPTRQGSTMTALTAGDDVLLRPEPFRASVMQIEPQWIDYNGHLNMAYYNVMFDRAIDELWFKLGIGPGYMKERNGSTFTAECHVRYLREIHLGDPVQVSILLVGGDEKRLHTFEELRHATEGWLSATSENMTIHIDMTARKTAPFPPDIRARVQALADAHSAIARHEGIGRKVAMPSK